MADSGKHSWDRWKSILIGTREHFAIAALSFMVFVGFSKLLQGYGHGIYLAMDNALGTVNLNFLIGLSVLTVGVGAAAFKNWDKELYGLVELVFGIVSGYSVAFSVSPERSSPSQWASLMGCAYVIARGVGNMNEGLEEKGKKRFAKTAGS